MRLVPPRQIPGIHEPQSEGGAGGTVTAEEVILTFPDNVSSGTAINIQDGTYAGGGPATVEGSMTLTLPAAFNTDALIQALLNGQEIKKGDDVTRVSSTQLSFSIKLKKDDQVKVRQYA